MATTAELEYLIKVNDRDLKDLQKNVRDTNKALGQDTVAAGKKSGGALARFGKVAVIGAGVALGGLAIGAKLAWDELAEGQRVSAQTAAVLKSTGGAAKVTQKDVEGLAQGISDYSGLDDDVVQSGANMLLTFTNVQNRAGAGNKIFDTATKTLADMSTALGQDMPKSAIQLGKALNDPIKGVTALQRVGVTFTQGQKDSIKAMVDSGNVAGAQKIILAELNKEFGGSAKAAGQTLPGQLNIAKNSFMNLAADLLSVMIPALLVLTGVLSGAAQWLSRHQTLAKILVVVLAGLATAVLVIAGVTKVWAAAQRLLNVAMMANPIGLAIIVLIALAAALVIAWKHSETFRDIVIGTWNDLKAAAIAVWGFIGPYVMAVFSGIVAFFRAQLTVLLGLWNVFAGVFTGDWRRVWDGIKQIVSGVLGAILAIVRAQWDVLKAAATSLGSKAVDGIKAGLATIGAAVRDSILIGIQAVKNLWDDGFNAAKTLGSKLVDGAKAGLSAFGSAVTSLVKAPINAVIGAFNGLSIPSFSLSIPMPGPVPDISFSSPSISLPDIPRLARGASYFGGGLAMVGERGPELVALPRGSQVHPTGQGPDGGWTLNIYPSGSAADDPRALAAAIGWELRTVMA